MSPTQWLVAGVVIALLVTLLATGYRLRRKVKELRRSLRNQTHQIAALTYLTHNLEPRQLLPPMGETAACADFACLIWDVMMEQRPRVVVDLGSGISTLIEAYAAERLGEGRVVALEEDPDFASKAEELLRRHQVADFAEVRHAPLKPVAGTRDRWYDLSALEDVEAIDLLVVDGPFTGKGSVASRQPVLSLLSKRLRPGAIILVDDADREPEAGMVQSWMAVHPVDGEKRELEKGAWVLVWRGG